MKKIFTFMLVFVFAATTNSIFAYQGILDHSVADWQDVVVEVQEVEMTWEDKVHAYAEAHPEKVSVVYAKLDLVMRTFTMTVEEEALVGMIMDILKEYLDYDTPEDEAEEILEEILEDMTGEDYAMTESDWEETEEEVEEVEEEPKTGEADEFGDWKSKDKNFIVG